MANESSSKCWYDNVCENKTDECTTACIRYLEMLYLMDTSNIPKAKQTPVKLVPSDVDYDAFMHLAHIKDNIIEFTEKGYNLYIVSTTTGNGKTSWAIKLMLKYFNDVWAGNGFRPRGLFIHVPTLLLQLKDFNRYTDSLNEIKKLLPVVDLVIWDDIGSLGLTNYDMSQLLMYLDQRVLEEKANIFTGNLLDMDLMNALGVRIYSRVWNTSDKVIFHGKDRRGLDGTIADNK